MSRLYRRVCVLRAQGDHPAADALAEGSLADAIAALQIETPEAASREALDALFAAEEERVANASVLAELLAPLLQARLTTSLPHLPARPPASERRSSPPSAEHAVQPRTSTTVPDIAGFIDEMIALERTR